MINQQLNVFLNSSIALTSNFSVSSESSLVSLIDSGICGYLVSIKSNKPCSKSRILSTGISITNFLVTAYIIIGTKGRDYLARRGYNITDDCSDVINEPLYTDARDICDKLLERFADGQIGEIYLAYTSFKNTVVHEPKLIKLLPVSVDTESVSADKEDTTPMNYEPAEDEALNLIIPKYVCSLIYGALIEAVASENGARMQAMDNATSNADEMISDLSLKYNRARQASITQELTEIIAGANAIG